MCVVQFLMNFIQAVSYGYNCASPVVVEKSCDCAAPRSSRGEEPGPMQQQQHCLQRGTEEKKKTKKKRRSGEAADRNRTKPQPVHYQTAGEPYAKTLLRI